MTWDFDFINGEFTNPDQRISRHNTLYKPGSKVQIIVNPDHFHMFNFNWSVDPRMGPLVGNHVFFGPKTFSLVGPFWDPKCDWILRALVTSVVPHEYDWVKRSSIVILDFWLVRGPTVESHGSWARINLTD